MLEYWKRISCGRCLTKALGLKVPKATEDKFKLATDLFLMYNSTPEIRMLKSIDKKNRRDIYDAR
jgi:hypothetical protein